MVKKGRKSNNNKQYGLGKERELKNRFLSADNVLDCTRSRGSFGGFDIQVFLKDHCELISVKSTRSRYWSPTAELQKLRAISVPAYCRKWLYIWWSPRADRVKKGWELIEID